MYDDLDQGSVGIERATIRSRIVGEGPTIVFVHGVYGQTSQTRGSLSIPTWPPCSRISAPGARR